MARLEWFQGENVFPLKTKVSSEQNARLLDLSFGLNAQYHIWCEPNTAYQHKLV